MLEFLQVFSSMSQGEIMLQYTFNYNEGHYMWFYISFS